MNSIKPAKAVIYCVTEPTDAQKRALAEFIEKRHGVLPEIEVVKDDSVRSGFCLSYGSELYDWSAEGRLGQLREKFGKAVTEGHGNVISMLRATADEFHLAAKSSDVGFVASMSDGIAEVTGLDTVFYGEILMFESGVKAMALELKKDSVGCIIFGDDTEVRAGDRVIGTGKNAGVPVGDAFLGRAVNALGSPIDGLGEIESTAHFPAEASAPSIIDRAPVCKPLETGILTIDSMFPIGKGQRELIIGDRQTGKTAIAVDTILNQKGKNVICIYVAIGQKAGSVAQTLEVLRRGGALEYTVLVAATAGESASMQYIAPFSGCAYAEYFMSLGKDVLIVYDDLSKHAVAYRSISLLLERSPGREAYPGDVFYLHSRLLERSAHLSEEKGGGSITALPIIETQDGDVSAYIPTNVISITDGQLFLESSLFFAGQRPAVNIGLSVSRVGGAAQTPAMKKAAGTIRLDLAQYREMKVFTQLAGDLDEETVNSLKYGEGLTALLKQEQYRSFDMAEQVIMLVAALGKTMLGVDTDNMPPYRDGLLKYVRQTHPEIFAELETTEKLSDGLREKIVKAAAEYRAANGADNNV